VPVGRGGGGGESQLVHERRVNAGQVACCVLPVFLQEER
jgi:hypothetical protein